MHTPQFGENPLMFTQVDHPETKNGRTDVHMTDGWTHGRPT